MVTPTYYPSIGGIETFIETIAKKLNERGVDTDIMTLNRTVNGEPLWKGGVVDTEAGKVIRLPTLRAPEFNLCGKTITPLKVYLQTQFVPKLDRLKLVEDYDILHFHNENDLSLLMFSSSIRKPRIFHYHILSISLPYLKRKEKILCKYLLKKTVTYHLVNSEYSKRLLESMGIDSKRISVVLNAIDLTRYAPSLVREQKIKTDHETRRVLYISRLSFEKLQSVESVINSAPMLSEHVSKLRIIVVGMGPYYNYVKELGEKVNKELDKKIITVLGEVEETEKRRLIGSSDIVVGVSRVALEAMSCGKPALIVGDRFIEGRPDAFFGGIVTRENVEDLKYYNFCYRKNSERTTPEKVAQEALKLLSDESYAAQIGAFGRDFVKKHYDGNNIAQQLEKLYKNLEN